MPQRKREGMNRGFGGAVHRENSERDECESRRYVEEGRALLTFQVWQKFRSNANKAKQIGLNFRKHRRMVDGFSGCEIVSSLHPGIVEDTVEGGKSFDDFPSSFPYGGKIRNIHDEI